jgi:hypothetical protein
LVLKALLCSPCPCPSLPSSSAFSWVCLHLCEDLTGLE